MNPEKLELLITREMPFGKYKGRIIADLPGPYLNWFAREGFPHGELGGLLALMQEIDHNGLSELLEQLRAKHGKPTPRHYAPTPCHGMQPTNPTGRPSPTTMSWSRARSTWKMATSGA